MLTRARVRREPAHVPPAMRDGSCPAPTTVFGRGPSLRPSARRVASIPAVVWCYGMAVAPDGQQVLIGGPNGAYSHRSPEQQEVAVSVSSRRRQHVQYAKLRLDASGQVAATAPGYSLPPARKAVRVWDLARAWFGSYPLCLRVKQGDGFDWSAGDLAFNARAGCWRLSGRDPPVDPESGGEHVDLGPTKVVGGRHGHERRRPSGLSVGIASTQGDAEGPGRPARSGDADATIPLVVRRTASTAVALDPSGRTLATGDVEGAIRVGLAEGEAHLLLATRAPSRRSPSPRQAVDRVRQRR